MPLTLQERSELDELLEQRCRVDAVRPVRRWDFLGLGIFMFIFGIFMMYLSMQMTDARLAIYKEDRAASTMPATKHDVSMEMMTARSGMYCFVGGVMQLGMGAFFSWFAVQGWQRRRYDILVAKVLREVKRGNATPFAPAVPE